MECASRSWVGWILPKGCTFLSALCRWRRHSRVRLDIYGVVQNSANAAYKNEMLALARRRSTHLIL